MDGAGDTVGFYVNGDGTNHGFYKPAGGAFTTVDRPGTAFNQLLGINQSDTEIAGYSSTDEEVPRRSWRTPWPVASIPTSTGFCRPTSTAREQV